MMRFYCLRRARLAKSDVLTRILEKQVSDGEWVGSESERKKGADYFKSLRDAYMSGSSVEELLAKNPGVKIRYRPDLKRHEVALDSQ